VDLSGCGKALVAAFFTTVMKQNNFINYIPMWYLNIKKGIQTATHNYINISLLFAKFEESAQSFHTNNAM
jgi:hypothetical protein